MKEFIFEIGLRMSGAIPPFPASFTLLGIEVEFKPNSHKVRADTYPPLSTMCKTTQKV